MENPGEAHWEVIRRVFKYLKGTKNNELIIAKIKSIKQQIFSTL
jgi:hypothetical protein